MVNLIISSEDYLKCAHEDNEIYRIGIIKGSSLYCKENKQCLSMDISSSILVECSQIEIKRIENVINFYAYNVQENKWVEASSSIIPEIMLAKKMFIGINTNLWDMFVEIWKGVLWCINHGYYIELILDE